MYEVADYKKLYNPTNSSGGELLHAKYVKMPVKPRGKGLRALLKNPKGLEIFAIWSLLLEAATETTSPDLRGQLLNHKDEPASIEEIAESISLDRQKGKVKNALSILVEMGWMKYTPNTDSIQNDSVTDPDAPPPKISEDKGSEDNLKLSEEEDKLSLNEGFKKNSSALDLEQQKKAIRLTEKLEKVFEYQTPNERTTFRNIVRHLLDCGMIEAGSGWLKEVLQWGSDNEKDQLDMKKLFVDKAKKKSGFKKKEE